MKNQITIDIELIEKLLVYMRTVIREENQRDLNHALAVSVGGYVRKYNNKIIPFSPMVPYRKLK